MKKNNYKLDQSTKEKLKYYVYLLIDPRDSKVFYVGKGKNIRIYNHLVDAEFSEIDEFKSKKPEIIKKLKKIKSIQREGKEIGLEILRHGMEEKEALEVEGAMIDYFGLTELVNLVQGQHSNERGKMSLREIKILYESVEAQILEPSILIKINNTFSYDMSEGELYEATRKAWKINIERASKAKLIFSVYRGIIRGIFQDCEWSKIKEGKDKGRGIFIGKPADQIYLNKYLDKSVSLFQERGAIYPIRYLNIN